MKYHPYDLPLLGDHTNRIERMFWSLKQSLRDTFGNLSKTPSCLMHIVTFADNRLEERYNYNKLKSLKIYGQDEFVRKLNEEAADLLNDRGCIVFHQALKLYQEKKINLSYRGNLVIESFGELEKSYQATSSTVTEHSTKDSNHHADMSSIYKVRS